MEKKDTSKQAHARLGPFRDENHLVRTGLILVLVTLAIINAAYIVNRLSAPQEENDPSIVTSQPHRLRSNQIAKTPSLETRISEVSETTRPDAAFKLAKDEKLLMLRLSVTNRTDRAQQFIPTSVLFVRTEQGDTRAMQPSIYLRDNMFSGTLNPGQTEEGQVAFGIPANTTNPLLYIDTGWNDEVPVVFMPLK